MTYNVSIYIVYYFNITFGQIKCCEVEFFETFHRVIQPISYFLLHDVIDTQELRIRNSRGEVLAIQQGKRIGLLGKSRDNAKEVDVSLPHFFNLIRAAMNALNLT